MAKNTRNNFDRMKKLGRKCVLSETEEQVFVDLLSLLAKWGSPLKPFDVRILVRDYLNSIPNRHVEAFRDYAGSGLD